MSMAASLPDATSLVDEYLETKVGVRRSMRGHQMLRVREHASKKEVEQIYKRLAPWLHPDKHQFQDWATTTYGFDLDAATLVQARNLMLEQWQLFKQTKERMVEMDEGLYKQAHV